MRYKSTVLFLMVMMVMPSIARAQTQTCTVSDLQCLYRVIEAEASKMDEPRWRNQAYRDLAVSKAMGGDYDGAIALITKIDNDDTKAMTVRAIGMALAIHQDLPDETYKMMFSKLDAASKNIADSGARDIAYTYIAMAQAFAGLDDDATKTTVGMNNPALKHKAYSETAEIQAERGDQQAALASINAIDSTAFKNKALNTVSGIFLKNGATDTALKFAMMIDNPTKKIDAIQAIIDEQHGLNDSKGSQ